MIIKNLLLLKDMLPWQPYGAFTSKSIVLFKKQEGEIFSNCYIACYQECYLKYLSLKIICMVNKEKEYFLAISFLIFCYLQNGLKSEIYTQPIDLKIKWRLILAVVNAINVIA